MAWFWLRTAAKRRRARASIFWCIRAIRVESHEGVTGTMVRKLPLARIERQKGRQAVGAGSMAAGQGGTKAKLTGAQQARLVQQMDAWMESVNDIGALQRLNQILADRHGPPPQSPRRVLRGSRGRVPVPGGERDRRPSHARPDHREGDGDAPVHRQRVDPPDAASWIPPASSAGTGRVSRRARGEGQLRRRADGSWEGRFTTGGQRRSVFADTKDECAHRLREKTMARDRGVLAAPNRATIASYLQTWLTGAQPSLRPMTFQSYESIIRTQLAPRLGRIRLTQLRPQHVQLMLTEMLADGLAPKYVRNCHGVLHRALDRAVQWRQLAVNPADGVDLPQREPREMSALSPDQARAVLEAAADDPLAALWMLMLTTGLRQGELRAVRWRDVDLDAARLAVTANSVKVTKRVRGLLGLTSSEPFRGEPKTACSRRVVEMPALAVEALRRHREHTSVINLNGLIFTRPDGRAIAVQTVYAQWHRLLERAGVPTVRPHDARHTTATLLLGQGVHPKLVS
jgi:integrase